MIIKIIYNNLDINDKNFNATIYPGPWKKNNNMKKINYIFFNKNII